MLLDIQLKDFYMLKKVFENATLETQKEMEDFSLWNLIDLSPSEVNLGSVMMKDGMITYIKDNELRHMKIVNRVAYSGDIVFIKECGGAVTEEMVGRCYKVFARNEDCMGTTRSVLRAYDFMNGFNEYFIGLRDGQYIVLENSKGWC